MKVRWTPEALEDRLQIWDYIAAEDPQAALRLDQRIAGTVSLLEEAPSADSRAGTLPQGAVIST